MLLKGGRGSLYFHMGLIGIDVTRNGIEPSSRLRSALQQNLIAFMVMALALPLKTGRVEGIGGGKKTKYQNVFTNVFRTTLENIIEHHRMFSNLLSRMRARSRPLLSPVSLSPRLHFYLFEYFHAEISLRILLNISTNRALVSIRMPVWREIENPIRGINNDNSRRVAGHGRSSRNDETFYIVIPPSLPPPGAHPPPPFFPWQLSQFRRVSFKINRES